VLLDAGISSFYVQAGADLYTHGEKPDGSPVLDGLRDPFGDLFERERLRQVVESALRHQPLCALLVRAVIDWYLERLESGRRTATEVEDIPIS